MRAIALCLVATAAFGQTAAALRDDVSYLASDELQGRGTPSPGLDLAAKFIAGKFRQAGLEPAAPGYFQGPNGPFGPWNVAGILRGSDPALQRQYVILSAHYDHLGRGFPGANDDASGVASMMEIAAEFARATDRPKRSVLFLAFFGEEEDLSGSRYYVGHPLVPLRDTVADINLEQLGRTDDESGRQVKEFGMTDGGWYTNLDPLIAQAVEAEGVRIYHRAGEDRYFDRSDNYSFARKHVVDTTIFVALEFPDYHKQTDTPDKLDYDNLATVDRGIAAAIRQLGNSPERPVWKHNPLLP